MDPVRTRTILRITADGRTRTVVAGCGKKDESSSASSSKFDDDIDDDLDEHQHRVDGGRGGTGLRVAVGQGRRHPTSRELTVGRGRGR